jgi:O-antigen/teichoic acid export membrane protein
MGSLRRVVRNTTALLASNILGKGISFLSILIAARYLGAKGYGLIVFALSFNNLFKGIIDLGFTPLIVKDVARDHSLALPYVRKIVSIKMYLLILSFLLISIGIKALGYSGNESIVIYMFFVFSVLYSFADVGFGVLKAFEETHYFALGKFIFLCFVFLGYSLSAYAGGGVVSFSIVYAITGMIALLYSVGMVRWLMGGMKMDMHAFPSGLTSLGLIRDSLPFALIAAFNLILLFLDSVMLGILRTQSEVGMYGVAYRTSLLFVYIPLSLHASLVPALSQLYARGSDAVALNVMRSFRYNLIAGVPIGVGCTLLAWRIIPLVFGSEYYDSSMIFAILIWSIVFTFVRYPFVTLFEATDKQSSLARTLAIAVIINIIINLLLIPPYGMIGAAIATVASETVAMLLMIWQGTVIGVCKLDRDFWLQVLKLILSGIVMGFVCYMTLDSGLVLSVISSVTVYSFMIWIMGVLKEEDKAMICRIIRHDR